MNDAVESCITRIIGYAGAAKSCYIKAIDAISDPAEYEKMISEGDRCFDQAHQAHFSLLNDSSEKSDKGLLLMMHAEDQLTSAETFRVLAQRIKIILQN